MLAIHRRVAEARSADSEFKGNQNAREIYCAESKIKGKPKFKGNAECKGNLLIREADEYLYVS